MTPPKINAGNLRPVTPSTILSEKLNQLHLQMIASGTVIELLPLIEQCKNLITPLDHYLLHSSSQPSSALNDLEIETNKLDWDSAFAKAETDLPLEKEMLSGAVEGQFLKMLTAISKAKRVLEIGSFTGYASLAIAEALPENGVLIACEYDKFTADFAQQQLAKSEHGKKVTIKVGDALQTLDQLITDGEQFDLVFIDADKQGYQDYYDKVLDGNLLYKDGIICVDNTLYQGQAYSPNEVSDNGKAIQKFNESIAQDSRVDKVLLPLRDGLTIIRRVI